MKIVIIATSGFFPINIGGPASVGYFLAKEFGESGNEVTVFIRVKDKKEHLLVQNLPEFASLTNVKIIPILISYDLKTFLNFPLIFFKIISLTYQFTKYQFDVVLYNSPPVDVSLLIPIVARLAHLKQFLIFHGGLFNESKNLIGRILIKVQINYFKKIIAISSYSEEIVKNIGVKNDKITIINNGVDLRGYTNLAKFNLPGYPKLLYVGRLEKIKGVDVLIKAFKTVHEQLPDSYLCLVGDGSEKENLKKLAKELGIFDFINFVGYVPPGSALYSYYTTCHILILPSYIENFPITLLEAMYFKIPIISTRIKGGVTELIKDGVNGLLVNPGNSAELADNIIKLANNTNMQNKFSKYNISLITGEYTWELISKKYIDIFKEN